jgi:hypothetical protein
MSTTWAALAPAYHRGNQDRVTYVNQLVGMALGTIDIANGQICFSLNQCFQSHAGRLPTNGRGKL